MPPQSKIEQLLPSVLDRLIDPTSAGTSASRGYTLERLIEAVRRDVEDLLNTHRSCPELPEDFTELPRSIVAYGLPDLLSTRLVGPEDFEIVARIVEQTIAQFEPRLKNIRATCLEIDAAQHRQARLKIEAMLAVDPFPSLLFNSLVELGSGQFQVSQVEA